ncbi:MAG TPA: PIG-L family deacetylase [Gemmatimonadaceae bacterium]|nr:PIG-L family deacetylase [Gemmatimonadaceae bacterium]
MSLALVFAHPDDETFGAGAAIARYAAAGVRCVLFCATNGDAGKTSGVNVGSPEGLGRARRRELEDAALVLGISTVVAPGYGDGALAGADPDRLVGEIVRFLREHRARVVVTFGPEGGPNAHRDHRAISRVATAAFFLAGNASIAAGDGGDGGDGGPPPHRPDRLYYLTTELTAGAAGGRVRAAGLPPTARLDARAHNDTKRAAFEAHATQHQHRETFEALSMRDFEPYAFAAGVPQPRAVVEDLFEGL